MRQCEELKAIHLGTAVHDCQPIAAELADPRIFLLHMCALNKRKKLTTAMLLWLKVPISIGCSEGALSFLTQARNDLSWRRPTHEHVLGCVWRMSMPPMYAHAWRWF